MTSYRELLLGELERRKIKNPRYTLRSFARDLGISATTLSGVLTGERHLSSKNAVKVGISMKWDREAMKSVLAEIGYSRAHDEAPIAYPSDKDSMRAFDQISRWYYFAVLRLAELDENQANARWIAARLNISQQEASDALQKLVEMGQLRIEGERFRGTGTPFYVVTDPATDSMKRFESEILEMARDSVVNADPDSQLSLVSTVMIDPSYLKRGRKLVYNFSRRLTSKLRGRTPKEVYFLSVQVTPAKKLT